MDMISEHRFFKIPSRFALHFDLYAVLPIAVEIEGFEKTLPIVDYQLFYSTRPCENIYEVSAYSYD